MFLFDYVSGELSTNRDRKHRNKFCRWF